MDEDAVVQSIRDFVSHFADIPDVQYCAVPYDLDSHEGIGYLLMVASVNQGTAAEYVRDFIRALYDRLGGDLLRFHHLPPSNYQDIISQYGKSGWRIASQLPKILCSASRFVETAGNNGGLVKRGCAQPDAITAASRIAQNIFYMGKDPLGARKKVWMFMRWMVRPHPDIGVWHPPLNPADLRIPLDVNTGRAFTDLCNIPAIKVRVAREGIWFTIDARGNLESDRHNVENVTQIAQWIYPGDPARLDYAFFCYGRRFGRGEDEHRCWKIVGCAHCPIKESFQCKGI